MGGDFSWVVKMQKIGVTIKIRNSCMNNSVEALILFNKEHQGLLKLHVHFGVGWGGGGEVQYGGRGNEAVLCCIASGKSSVNRFSLREFRYFVFDVIA